MEARKALTSQKKQCTVCNSEFSCVSARNRHMKNFHEELVNDPKKSHIICPLCTETVLCGNYDKLDTHLEVNHEEKLENETITFADVQGFEEWFEHRKIETTYACTRSNKRGDYMQKYYNCNRSNWKGHNSNCHKRTEKAGASIKINGVCPSRLSIRFYHTGQITVKFCKSHVGHEEEIRSQHLSKLEKTEIVKKLYSGVTVDRIVSDARKLTSEKITRMNMLTRSDVQYLNKKNNNKEIEHFVREQRSGNNELHIVDENGTKEAEISTLTNLLRSLNNEDYKKCMGKFFVILEEVSRSAGRKRKMVKQEFFPSKRKQ